jgi:uncharacterized protein (DUF305 family)
MLPDVNTLAVPELQVEPVPGRTGGALTRSSGTSRLAEVSPRPTLALIALLLCLGGCDSGTAAAPPAPTPAPASSAPVFGGTDRAWVEITIAMNEELLPLLALARERTGKAQVNTLAADAEALTRQELAALYELHAAAGLPATNPHKGMPMPGMVTPEQVAEAAAETGPAFDALLVKHLRAHLDQGVKLATSERKSGVEPRTRALAERMIADRTEMSVRVRGTGT